MRQQTGSWKTSREAAYQEQLRLTRGWNHHGSSGVGWRLGRTQLLLETHPMPPPAWETQPAGISNLE